MESSDCRRRPSDAEQSAWSCSVTVKREPVVKEEPAWGECGVSEAATAEHLYPAHEVKDELVIGPEQIQQQDIAFLIHSQRIVPPAPEWVTRLEERRLATEAEMVTVLRNLVAVSERQSAANERIAAALELLVAAVVPTAPVAE